jgi:hypothetical protein
MNNTNNPVGGGENLQNNSSCHVSGIISQGFARRFFAAFAVFALALTGLVGFVVPKAEAATTVTPTVTLPASMLNNALTLSTISGGYLTIEFQLKDMTGAAKATMWRVEYSVSACSATGPITGDATDLSITSAISSGVTATCSSGTSSITSAIYSTDQFPTLSLDSGRYVLDASVFNVDGYDCDNNSPQVASCYGPQSVVFDTSNTTPNLTFPSNGYTANISVTGQVENYVAFYNGESSVSFGKIDASNPSGMVNTAGVYLETLTNNATGAALYSQATTPTGNPATGMYNGSDSTTVTYTSNAVTANNTFSNDATSASNLGSPNTGKGIWGFAVAEGSEPTWSTASNVYWAPFSAASAEPVCVNDNATATANSCGMSISSGALATTAGVTEAGKARYYMNFGYNFESSIPAGDYYQTIQFTVVANV